MKMSSTANEVNHAVPLEKMHGASSGRIISNIRASSSLREI